MCVGGPSKIRTGGFARRPDPDGHARIFMSAAEKVFLDTNVPVYAHDRNEATKGPLAHTLLTRLLAAGRPLFSIQVLSEFYWAVTRKIPIRLTHDEAVA